MIAFTSRPAISLHRHEGSRTTYALLHSPLRWKAGEYSGETPAAFCTDGNSTPRFLWSLLYHPLDAMVIRASAMHDYMYRKGFALGPNITRKIADRLYYEALISEGANRTKARIMYWGVRLLGRDRFNDTNLYWDVHLPETARALTPEEALNL